MAQHSKAPAENHENKIDFLNPAKLAGIGVKKSVEMLQSLLGKKEEGISKLKPKNTREGEQIAVTKNAVQQRRLLAQEITPTAVA